MSDVTIRCSACMGTGEIESSDSTDETWWDCRSCGGTGKRTIPDRRTQAPPLADVVRALADHLVKRYGASESEETLAQADDLARVVLVAAGGAIERLIDAAMSDKQRSG